MLIPDTFFYFRCCECGCILSHWYYEKEEQLYCKKHYWARYGGHCHGCKETITTGLIMVTRQSLTIELELQEKVLYHKLIGFHRNCWELN